MTDEDPMQEIWKALGVRHPVDELAQIIHDCTDLGALSSQPTGTDVNAAWGVYRWYQIRMLDHEHVHTAAQDWYSRNHHTVLPDWGGLYKILSGDQMQP